MILILTVLIFHVLTVMFPALLLIQFIRFARASSHLADFNALNRSLMAKLLQQEYRYHKLRKSFSKFYRRHFKLLSKYTRLRSLLQQGLLKPDFLVTQYTNFEKL